MLLYAVICIILLYAFIENIPKVCKSIRTYAVAYNPDSKNKRFIYPDSKDNA